ncbi:MAG: porin family protein [Muribaculaceae bacterium]|nr:porin family protein [Muribaculaceae bacterium]
MNILKRFWALALALAVVMPAMAQFKFGPRLGVNVNSLHFNEETFASDNRAGFTGGLTCEFTVPIIGIGMDASVMYVKRSSEWMQTHTNATTTTEKVNSDYIEIPLNVKYKLSLPLVSKIIAPYVFTGPSFAFKTSKLISAIQDRRTDIAWNFGLGVQLINHLQIGASYGLGLTKVVQFAAPSAAVQGADIQGKNRYWTITAAWLF